MGPALRAVGGRRGSGWDLVCGRHMINVKQECCYPLEMHTHMCGFHGEGPGQNKLSLCKAG